MRWRVVIGPPLGLASCVGLAACFVVPIFVSSRDVAQRSSCQSNLRQLALAYAQYVQDADGVSPPISTLVTGQTVDMQGRRWQLSGPAPTLERGWAELLEPYIDSGSWEVFQCPGGYRPSQPQRTDYFYNARLAHVGKVPFPAHTLLFGDGYDNSGTNAHLLELPLDWKVDEERAEQRHDIGLNCVCVDGHVKWMPPLRITTQPPSSTSDVTFAVK